MYNTGLGVGVTRYYRGAGPQRARLGPWSQPPHTSATTSGGEPLESAPSPYAEDHRSAKDRIAAGRARELRPMPVVDTCRWLWDTDKGNRAKDWMESGMVELTAYSVKLKKMVSIKDPELVTLKNGRKAIVGVAEEDPTNKVFRIIGDSQIEEVLRLIS